MTGTFRRLRLPSMTAKTWATMDESLFRQLVDSGMSVMVGMDAERTIRARMRELGIRDEDEGKRRAKYYNRIIQWRRQ